MYLPKFDIQSIIKAQQNQQDVLRALVRSLTPIITTKETLVDATQLEDQENNSKYLLELVNASEDGWVSVSDRQLSLDDTRIGISAKDFEMPLLTDYQQSPNTFWGDSEYVIWRDHDRENTTLIVRLPYKLVLDFVGEREDLEYELVDLSGGFEIVYETIYDELTNQGTIIFDLGVEAATRFFAPTDILDNFEEMYLEDTDFSKNTDLSDHLERGSR